MGPRLRGDDTEYVASYATLLASWDRAPESAPDVSGMSMCLMPKFGERVEHGLVDDGRRGCRAQPASPQPLVPSGLDFAGNRMIARPPSSECLRRAANRVSP